MTREDLLWLAGLLEGEGSFVKGPPSSPRSPQVSLEMTDEDVVARVSALVGVKYYAPKNRSPGRWRQTFHIHVRGARAVDLMRGLRPFMMARRSQQIANALAHYSPKRVRYRNWDDDALLAARKTMSLREMGRRFGINHETIRKRLKKLAA